jgi:hypothetical protein
VPNLSLARLFDDDPERLKKAEKIARAVANDFGCTTVKWVRIEHISGLIDAALSDKLGEAWRINSALGALRRAEVEGLKHRMPLEWARLQSSWCLMLTAKASVRNNPTVALKALERLDQVEAMCSPNLYPILWIMTEARRAHALALLVNLDSSPTKIEQTILALRDVVRLSAEQGLDGADSGEGEH